MTFIEMVSGFEVYFEAEKEFENKRKHFIEGCGWSEKQYKDSAKDTKWFSAHVEIRRGAIVLSDQYLGCCCYATVKEFYTTYHDDYFADMVREGVAEARELLPDLIATKRAELAALEGEIPDKYRVTWEIDADADTPQKAASEAWDIMTSDNALPPVFVVRDKSGKETIIDLDGD